MSADIITNINIVLEKIYSSIDGKVYNLLDDLCVISTDIITKNPLNKIFIDGSDKGMEVIAFSLISCYVISLMVEYMMSMYNGNKPSSIYKRVIKIIICSVFMSSSIYICKVVININYIFTEMIADIGETLVGEKICFESFKEKITDLNEYMNQDFVSLDGIIKGFVSFGTITLLINYASRYVTIIFIILTSPIAIMFSASNLTRGIFKAWIKTGITNLFIQWITMFILIVPLAFNEIGTTIYKVIIVGTIYLMYRINSFSREILGNISEKVESEIKNIF